MVVLLSHNTRYSPIPTFPWDKRTVPSCPEANPETPVTSIVVTAGSNEVTINDAEDATPLAPYFTGNVSFKSGAVGATWQNEKWTLTPAGD